MSNLTWEQRQAMAKLRERQLAEAIARQQAMPQPVPQAPLAQPQQPIGLLSGLRNAGQGAWADFTAWLRSLTPEQQRQYQEAQKRRVEEALRRSGG